ncbi:FAD-dependent monooxygenase [Myxococcus stipitatus]|uniref:FAD-dependent monooxygenase n=1 Tax=Myxococcus stipitatus TaxID=83455 RepID=UPI0030D06E5D
MNPSRTQGRETPYDVIIAGAGPVGLFLACELRLAKLDVLVLEQSADARSPLKQLPFGLRGLWGPSIEAFYRRGLLDALAEQPQDRGGNRFKLRRAISDTSGPAGHFASLQFDFAHIDPSRWTYRIPGPADMQLGSELAHIERVLTERASALGVELRFGQGVSGFEASDEEVVVHAGEQRFAARYLVGRDGGSSRVRKQGGFEFVGTEPEFTGYSVHVDLAEPEMLPLGAHITEVGRYQQWQPGVVAAFEFDGGAFHRTQPITLEHVQAMLRRVSGKEVSITARSMQSTTYRKGRVLLAGDSAHIHSPLGGQGLNLGLGDAMNLGWKLAATVRGDAPEGLLDTYTAERHPIGERILDWTRAQVALMRPRSSALQAIVRDLMETRDGATYFAERLWGLSLRYDLGEAHPRAGRSSPDFEFDDGTRLGALLRDGQGVLLDFDRQFEALEGHWGHRVSYVTRDAKARLGVFALRIRPDGFVAWASDTTATPEEVTRAAARWFDQVGRNQRGAARRPVGPSWA